jgi:hypothetical protein
MSENNPAEGALKCNGWKQYSVLARVWSNNLNCRGATLKHHDLKWGITTVALSSDLE